MTGEKDLYKKAVDSSADPLVIYDRDGRAVYLNPAFERVFGWSSDELLGKRIDFVPESSREQTQKAIHQVLAGQVVLGMETQRRTKNRGTIHVRLSANAIWDDKKEYDGVIVTLQDITDLFQSRQEALIANRVKENFLSNISHEVRTPMNGLIGILDLLENTRLDTEQQEYVTVLQKSAAALMMVISDILDFSRIETGEMEYRMIDFDFRTMLESIPQTLFRKAEKKGTPISVNVDRKMPSQLKGDPEKLRQILVHLLGNAVKFTDTGQIQVHIAPVNETPTHVSFHMTVSDTGIGIPDNKLKMIFDSFSQADSGTTRKYGGLGIGLSLCSRLVNLMGGRIDVKSTLSKGSVFTVSLALEKQEVVEPDKLIKPTSIKGLRILIVDGDDAGRLMLKQMVSGWGCVSRESAGLHRALEKYRSALQRQEPFDIILISQELPDGQGERFAEKAVSKDRSGPMIILLTQQGMPGDVKRLNAAGVRGYLLKPVDDRMLFDCIATVMALEKAGMQKVVTRHFLNENRKQQTRILVLDDLRAGGRMMQSALTQSGFPVQVVSNQNAAVKQMETGRGNMIFLPINAKDGESVSTVSHLRSLQARMRIPMIVIGIIEDAKEKDAGIKVDDYLIEPVSANTLIRVAEKWSRRLHGTGKKDPATSRLIREGKQTGVFNFRAALERALEDKAFLKEILEEYCKSLPEKMKTMQNALKEKDSDALSLCANALKGSSANVGAEQLSSAARELEMASDIGDFDRAAGMVKQLETLQLDFIQHINSLDWSDA
jgi:two-component system sensor histidine kinase/response regulator